MQGTINFYSYSEFYSDATSVNRLLKFFTKLVSPAYAHSSLTVEGWVFSYGLDGYSMTRANPDEQIKNRVEVEITNPEALLNWENPKSKSIAERLIGFPLSLFSSRFNNCATVMGKTIGKRTTTPDKLHRELQR